MTYWLMTLFLFQTTLPAPDKALAPGNHERTVTTAEGQRSYTLHLPPQFDRAKPTPVVLAYHGAFTNGTIMAGFCGLNEKADREGFVVAYPNGTGLGKVVLFWNAGLAPARPGEKRADDVAFTRKILDDLDTVMTVDRKRVFAAGMSNGGFMVYRLAAELSDRIAAIAPVGGTMGDADPKPARPVPVIHFHGTADTYVRYGGLPDSRVPSIVRVRSVADTVSAWARADGCGEKPTVETVPDKVDDGTTVTRKTFGPGKDGAEVVLYTIQNGGHTWPGREVGGQRLGKSTKDINANDLIWEFFQKHPMK